MSKMQFFQMETKSVEVKADRIVIEGYASTPDIDSYDDIVNPSAFISSMASYMAKPIVLLQHNWEKIIGKTVDYRIENNGLWVKAEIFNDLDGCFKSIQEGLLGSFSIGFMAKSWNIFEKDERFIREITDLELMEYSVVTFPANKNAIFTLAKSLKGFFDGLETKSIGKYEVKGEEIEKIEEETIENPPIVEEKEEEEQKEPTNPENIETASGNLADDEEGIKKEEELRTLKEEVELLKKENVELKATLLVRDDELENIQELKAKTEKELEEKNLEIKSYLGNGNIAEYKANIPKTVQKTFIYSEFL